MMDEETRLRRRKQGIIIMTRGGMRAWTPARLGSKLLCEFDAEATSTLTLDTAAVTTWESTVGEFAPTQSTADNKPAWSATSFNGRPGVTFDGTNDYLEDTTFDLPDGAEECEMWALVSQNALVADATVRSIIGYGDSNAVRQLQRVVSGGANRGQIAVGTGAGTSSTPETTVDFSGIQIIRARITATAAFISLGGREETEGAAIPATALTRLRIGARAGGASATQPWNGVINYAAITGPLVSYEAARQMQYLRDRTNG